ncbi:MAG: SGNH/GDSL hydrolase family protein [Nitrospiraceae bacterium]
MIRKALINLAVLFVGTVVALVLAEILARALHPLSTVEYRMDSEVGPLLAPRQMTRWVNEDYDAAIVTNSAGFHDVEHTLDKPPNVYRIAVLGDSYIEALQLPIDQGFVQQLEHTISGWSARKRVEVINLGVSGSGPAQYYRILEKKGLAYKPDLVVMAVFPDNDFRDSFQSLSGTVFKPYYVIQEDGTLDYVPPHVSGIGVNLRPLLRRSAVLHLVRRAIVSLPVESWFANLGVLAPAGANGQDHARVSIPADWYVYVADPPDPWPDAYRVTLRMIKESTELAEQQGAFFLVMLIASTQTVEQRWQEALQGYSEAKTVAWDFGRPYREIMTLGTQSGFESIRLLEPFQQDFRATGRSHSWPHDGHWNQRGHRLAAEVVNGHLLQRRAEYNLN